ncbi:MAG: hypothetical protein ACR2LR_06010 [Hassallia sp.]
MKNKQLIKKLITPIVTEKRPYSQRFGLSAYISRGAFTDTLEFLEKRDVTGDTAVFILANLQVLGRGGEA